MNPSKPPLPLNKLYHQPLNYPKYVKDFDLYIHVKVLKSTYSDMKSHLMKLRLCFKKCKEYIISFNPKKCAFMVFSRLILGFIVSKEGKIPNPKKIQVMVNILVPTNP
jgi:hypothetical protein